MAIARINRFIRLFADAFRALSADVADEDVERLAMLIHDSMDQGRRVYHTSAHVFSMSEGMNARQVLATLFHDVVYVQLDGGFPRRARGVLKGVTRLEKTDLILKPIDSSDAMLRACATLFGFEAGQSLPLYGGLNEFLSAVVAMRELQRFLPKSEVLAIAACIEATVPFRGADPGGRESGEVLADRVRAAGAILEVPLRDDEIDSIVLDAVVLGNRDVGTFAAADPGTFLATTWQLIEESNAPLAAVGVYSIREYRDALTRMETFLASLNPGNVFHRWHGVPSDAEFAELRDTASRNIDFAGHYLGSKITTIAIIEALAMVTGGDCPVSMLLGDIQGSEGDPDRIERFLPEPPPGAAVDAELLDVLETGRAKESASDLTVSPLTAFVYRSLGHEGTNDARRHAARMFAGEISPRAFLATLDRTLVRNITQACAKIALSREDALRALEDAP